MEQKAIEITLSGSLINVYAPESQYKYRIPVSHLRWKAELRELIDEIKEIIAAANEKYNLRKTRGRQIQIDIRLERPVEKHIEEVRYNLIPYVPSRVESILSQARQQLYSEINRICVTIQKLDLGYARKRIYFLPASSTNEFIQLINDLNKQIKETHKILDDYKQSEYFKRLNKLLEKYGIEPIRNIPYPHPIYYDLIPIKLDADALRHAVEEKYMKDVEETILKTKKAIIESAVKKLQTQLDEIMEDIIKKRQANLDTLKTRLAELQKLAQDSGAVAITSEIQKMIRIIDHPEEEIRRREMKKLKEISDKRLKSLLESLIS